jgi:predicted ATPase/DNA-binding XRE family transcriptional regulator
MAETFGHLLKRHRVEAGLTQEALAERAGVSVDAIGYLERDPRHAPHKATLDLLVTALGLDDASRQQLEEAANLARARGPQEQRRGAFPGSSNESVSNTLPPQLTSFVDREREVPEIKELLRLHRFVTVVGTGGAGKTRCAIRVGQGVLESSRDGVWFAELAPISDPMQIATVLARALKVREAANSPVFDTLLAYLKHKRLLLIFDNCEHVLEEARRVVAAILNGCLGVHILATSRENFNIAGEQAYRMPSLPVPSASQLLSVDEMSQYGAAQLFSDRAASADNRFVLTVDCVPDVADICRRLDGIPLAIELAAARVKTLPPKQLARKLDERFRLLTGGDRSALPRHQTMRALMDWSHDLLSDDERMIFRRLSIFAGGFTLETAAAVCSEDAIDELGVLDLISSLVDKSLVQAEVAEGYARYRLLESTRQYAREKLSHAGEEETMAHAHARALLALAGQLSQVWEIAPDRVWYAQAEPEVENFRAALSWAFGPRGDLGLGQRLAGLLRHVWFSFGPAEGRRWLKTAQQRVTKNTPAAIVAALNLAEAQIALSFDECKAGLPAAERALAQYRELADQRAVALAEGLIGALQLGSPGKAVETERHLRQALGQARSLGARRVVISALQGLGALARRAGDLPGAREHYREALATARAIGAERHAAYIAIGLAEAEFQAGNVAEALRLAYEALAVLQAHGPIAGVAWTLQNTAAYLVASGRFDEARATARDAITAALDGQMLVCLAWTLQHLAAIAALRSRADAPIIEDRRRAARILGYVEAHLSALAAVRQYTERQEYDVMLPALREPLGEDELSKLMTEGATWSMDRAVAEAMLI